MKLSRVAASATAVGALVLASGCATLQSEPKELDTAYIGYVEQAAKRYSTQVIWVNLPMRPVSDQASAKPAAEPAK
ncbi:MAG: hypothetical protein MUC86_11675 [Burkholderiaceae bacterium]|jgi:hypothetical protein|nr:hypothetical protein [Burkholderiaceae bacterium]